jgi:hypothetical protein
MKTVTISRKKPIILFAETSGRFHFSKPRDPGSRINKSGFIRQNLIRQKLINLLAITPWSTVLPEKLTRPQLLNKFPAFYGTRRFITIFTRTRQLSLS